eukprot:122579_1
MLQKQINRAATLAWCPDDRGRTLLAAGTVEGMLDANFQSSTQLEIYDTSLSVPGTGMPIVGSVSSRSCFKKLSWGCKGIAEGSHPLGIIAGGMADGSLTLWDANSIVNQGDASPFISSSSQHSGGISCLEFHPLQPNLLASGSQDSEVFVWDLKNMQSPIGSPPGDNGRLNAHVSALAWNKKVPHILSTSYGNGQTCVWDLRKTKSSPVLTVRDSSHMNAPCTGVVWDPVQALQVVVSYSNAKCELWDLRNAMSPKVILEGGHQKSVLCVDWNPHDTDLLMTSGEDSCCVIWNAEGRKLHSFVTEEGPNFEIQWSKHTPSVFSGSAFAGKISTRSVQYTGPDHAPVWQKRPAGVSFAFGSRLAHFSAPLPPSRRDPAAPPKSAAPEPRPVEILHLGSDEGIRQKTYEFQQAMGQQDMRSYCERKIAESEDDSEQSTWKFINFAFQPNYRDLILKELGYEKPVKSASQQPEEKEGGEVDERNLTSLQHPQMDDHDFFDRISNAHSANEIIFDAPSPSAKSAASSAKSIQGESRAAVQEVPETETDSAVRRAVVCGDFEKAANLWFDAGNLAEALVIASCDGDLWAKIQKKFFDQHKLGFMKKTVSYVVTSDLEGLVKKSDLSNWKETLALIITFSTENNFKTLCNNLGSRLLKENKDIDSALVCHISALDVEQMTGALMASQKESDPLLRLHYTVEKAYAFATATNQQQPSDALSRTYCDYAELMASQGDIFQALAFLQMTNGNQPDVQSQALMDRMYQSNPSMMQNMQIPQFPFAKAEVPILCEQPRAAEGMAAERQDGAQAQQPQRSQQRGSRFARPGLLPGSRHNRAGSFGSSGAGPEPRKLYNPRMSAPGPAAGQLASSGGGYQQATGISPRARSGTAPLRPQPGIRTGPQLGRPGQQPPGRPGPQPGLRSGPQPGLRSGPTSQPGLRGGPQPGLRSGPTSQSGLRGGPTSQPGVRGGPVPGGPRRSLPQKISPAGADTRKLPPHQGSAYQRPLPGQPIQHGRRMSGGGPMPMPSPQGGQPLPKAMSGQPASSAMHLRPTAVRTGQGGPASGGGPRAVPGGPVSSGPRPGMGSRMMQGSQEFQQRGQPMPGQPKLMNGRDRPMSAPTVKNAPNQRQLQSQADGPMPQAGRPQPGRPQAGRPMTPQPMSQQRRTSQPQRGMRPGPGQPHQRSHSNLTSPTNPNPLPGQQQPSQQAEWSRQQQPPQIGQQQPSGPQQPSRGQQMPSPGGQKLSPRNQQMPPRGQQMPGRGQQMPQRGQQMPSRGQQMPPRGPRMPSNGQQNPVSPRDQQMQQPNQQMRPGPQSQNGHAQPRMGQQPYQSTSGPQQPSGGPQQSFGGPQQSGGPQQHPPAYQPQMSRPQINGSGRQSNGGPGHARPPSGGGPGPGRAGPNRSVSNKPASQKQPVPGIDQPTVAQLKGILAQMESLDVSSVQRRKLKDVGKRLRTLENQVASVGLDERSSKTMAEFSKAMAAKKYAEAKQMQVEMITGCWETNADWLPGMKTMIELAKEYLP